MDKNACKKVDLTVTENSDSKFPPQFKKIRSVAVFCSARMAKNSNINKAALELGKFLGTHHMQLVYGGSDVGCMGIVSHTVSEYGGDIFGICPKLFADVANKNDTINIVVDDLSERKKDMLKLAHAIVILPGGFGTLDEFFEALTLRQIHMPRHMHPIGILNVDGFYDYMFKQLEVFLEQGMISESDLNEFVVSDNIEDLFIKLAQRIPE